MNRAERRRQERELRKGSTPVSPISHPMPSGRHASSHWDREGSFSGTRQEIIAEAERVAATLSRSISVGPEESSVMELEEGVTENFYSFEIELMCPHGNATDSWSFWWQKDKYKLEETGTDAWFDCRCQGVL